MATVRLILVRVAGAWRIADVQTASRPSLVATLTKGLGPAQPGKVGASTAPISRSPSLPPAVEYAGYTGSDQFPVFNDFKVTNSAGTLGGSAFMQIGIFSGDAPIVGSYANGECTLTRKKETYRGRCDANEFSGTIYDSKGKPGQSFRFQSKEQLARTRSAPQIAPAGASPGYASVGASQATPSVWSLGRARFLVEPRGGCPPQIALGTKAYCFDQAIGWLQRHPNKQSIDVVAMQNAWLPGTFVPHANGQGWNIYRVARHGDGFTADRQLHYATKVQVPQGCIYQDVAQQAWLIGISRRGKVAIEAASYVCANSWQGQPIYAAYLDTGDIDVTPGELQIAAGSGADNQGGYATTSSQQGFGVPQMRAPVYSGGDPSQAADFGGPPMRPYDYADVSISGSPGGSGSTKPKKKHGR